MQVGGASVIAGVAALSRAFLLLGCRSGQVRGLDRFLRILHSQQRRRSRTGLLTYANHISVLDEPLLWGALPFTKHGTAKLIAAAKSSKAVAGSGAVGTSSQYRSPFVSLDPANNARWTLAASDIVYTNAAQRAFFNTGQVLETFRGGSPFQPALDTAIGQLDQARWVHIFPEGYVNLSLTTDLRRFKWGISRLAMEAERAPVCLPIWITGFDQVMPEPRAAPRWLPRLGADVSITFGKPVSQGAMRAVLTPESRSVGAVPADASEDEGEAARLAREEAYWNESWQAGEAELGEPEEWEVVSGYDSRVARSAREMAEAITTSSAAATSTLSFSKPPPMNHFPPVPKHKPPPGGWPANPPGSRAARALRLDETDPARRRIRSTFSALLRDEMGRLGLCVRRAMGDGDGEGRLAHTIMNTKTD